MFIPILNFWMGFLFATLLVGIYIFIYFNIFGGLTEIKWKTIYFLSCWILTFFYLFFEIDIILQQYSLQLGDLLIIKDLQDLINISLDLSFWVSFWFVLPLLIFFFWTFFLPIWTVQERQSWSIFFFLSGYFYILFKGLLDFDLFLACWDFFKKIPQTFYDFQPDFLYVILAYLGDFLDLSKFICFVLCVFFLIFLFQWNIYKITHKLRLVIGRFFFYLLISFILFYFFGGESFFRDFFLFSFSFSILELYWFSYLFFYILKHKKIN